MILKKNLKQEPENQIVEDALCLGMYAWHTAHRVERCQLHQINCAVCMMGMACRPAIDVA